MSLTSNLLSSMRLNLCFCILVILVAIIPLSSTLEDFLTISKFSISTFLGSFCLGPMAYPHLMFDHMLNYHDEYYDGELPFAPYITQIVLALGLDLRFKVARVDLLNSLCAQFFLRKVDASVGRRCPLVNAPGGEAAAHAVPSHEDGLSLPDLCEDEAEEEPDIADLVGAASDNGKRPMTHSLEAIRVMFRREEEASSRGNLMMEDEDGISDYVPSPKYSF
ncbi:unnamed protein product [Linum trigynum]|uniref:Uncharacterized protein n=1 Tax=Linum trigynum TaxID=586398 RepID=A0AAV2DYZ0_9ROSI